MKNTLSAFALLSILCLVPACGAATPSDDAPSTTALGRASDGELSWTRSLLRKLDPRLRARVRSGDDSRLAVTVFFRARVADDELATLMLTQVGNHYVGNVVPDVLQRIAARADVDRIESLRDVGY